MFLPNLPNSSEKLDKHHPGNLAHESLLPSELYLSMPEIFLFNLKRKLMAVPVGTTNAAKASNPKGACIRLQILKT